jgi:hypothetical protein
MYRESSRYDHGPGRLRALSKQGENDRDDGSGSSPPQIVWGGESHGFSLRGGRNADTQGRAPSCQGSRPKGLECPARNRRLAQLQASEKFAACQSPRGGCGRGTIAAIVSGSQPADTIPGLFGRKLHSNGAKVLSNLARRPGCERKMQPPGRNFGGERMTSGEMMIPGRRAPPPSPGGGRQPKRVA